MAIGVFDRRQNANH
jgi:hypothetical protein